MPLSHEESVSLEIKKLTLSDLISKLWALDNRASPFTSYQGGVGDIKNKQETLVAYIYKSVQVYLNRRKHIFNVLQKNEHDAEDVEKFNT